MFLIKYTSLHENNVLISASNDLIKVITNDHVLQVCDWMNNRPDRFKISASDAVIQLDLIARVHRVSSAEGFFLNLTDDLKDKRTYGALLNAYVHSRSKEKAESLLDIMRSKSYLIHSLPFNLKMTLYMNLNERKEHTVGIFYYLIIFQYHYVGKYHNNNYISYLSIVSLN